MVLQDLGYTPDFVQSLGPLLGQVKEKGIRVVANAGGINPLACVQALRAAAEQAGITLSIAMVTGDDLLQNVRMEVFNGRLFNEADIYWCFVENRNWSCWSKRDAFRISLTPQTVHQHERLLGVCV